MSRSTPQPGGTGSQPVLSHNSPGIRANAPQFVLQLLQVFFVGLTVGMMRVVVPALAQDEFGLGRGDFAYLTGFIVAFGIAKAVMNLLAGGLSDRLGRKRILILGWAAALPIPSLIFYAQSWSWIIAATVLLGVNQGLTWSMTITAKLDLAAPRERGLANGLNEFFGYIAVAGAGLATAWLAERIGSRPALLYFGAGVIIPGLGIASAFVRETRPTDLPSAPHPPFWPIIRASWHDRRLLAICQAGLIEKFADALIWICPVFLRQRGLSLERIGWVVGAYAATWGAAQLLTGPLSDRFGRRIPITAGMLLCGSALAALPLGDNWLWWLPCSAAAGLGMALLYPALGAAAGDAAEPAVRGTVLGIYRFWRDLGYALGALALGLSVQYGLGFSGAFTFTGLSLILSGLLFAALFSAKAP